MSDDAYARYVTINLPHARTVTARIGRSLEALGGFGAEGNGGATDLQRAYETVEQSLRDWDEDPPMPDAIRAADHSAVHARALVAAIAATTVRGERLGLHVRNLFECLGLAEEGRRLSLECGERPDSPLR
jgi:hypothetical protein